jgi:RNA polymerase sigma-70 factor, ECF subfamily
MRAGSQAMAAPWPAWGTAGDDEASDDVITGGVATGGVANDSAASEGASEGDRARRFRDAALPHLDDMFAFARYLMRDTADAEDAVQECYLRALRHFDSYRGPAMKPWLLTILKNVCVSEFARRSKQPSSPGHDDAQDDADVIPMWQEPQPSPEAALLRQHDDATVHRLVAALPLPFRETLVLRDINDLSYREIAEVAGVPVGTVMSRLARARSMLRAAWNAEQGATS